MTTWDSWGGWVMVNGSRISLDKVLQHTAPCCWRYNLNLFLSTSQIEPLQVLASGGIHAQVLWGFGRVSVPKVAKAFLDFTC